MTAGNGASPPLIGIRISLESEKYTTIVCFIALFPFVNIIYCISAVLPVLYIIYGYDSKGALFIWLDYLRMRCREIGVRYRTGRVSSLSSLPAKGGIALLCYRRKNIYA